MTIYFFLSVVFLVASGLLAYFLIPVLRNIVYLTVFTTSYYGILGSLYWFYYNNSYFLGVYWGSDIFFASFLFTLFVFIFLFSFTLVSFYVNRQVSFKPQKEVSIPNSFWIVAIISIVSCMFVYIDRDGRGSFFLIAYQFSDMLIPIILILFAVGRNKVAMLFLSLFFFYCVFVGFRYKLVIVIFPLFSYWFLFGQFKRKILLATVMPTFVLSLFTLMTLYRVKFGGINIGSDKEINFDSILYGFFADSNILFGVISVRDYVIRGGYYAGLTPLYEMFIDLVPRALMPEKDVGQHLNLVLEGLIVKEAMTSGTTYPFFGEYMIMGGYPAAILGSILLGVLVAYFSSLILNFHSKKLTVMGIALVAVLFGYYYMSRGYLPQFFKAIVFILIPYIYFCKKMVAKNV